MFWNTKRAEKNPERRLRSGRDPVVRVPSSDSKPVLAQPGLASRAIGDRSADLHVLLALDFSSSPPAGLPGLMEGMPGAGATGEVRDGAYAISAWQAACSRRVALAAPGDKIVFDFKVRALADSTNNAPLTFSAGPLFYNAINEVIQSWYQQPALTEADGDRLTSIELIAPPGTFAVRIGVHGPWSPDGSVSDGCVGLVCARIVVA